MLEKWKAALAGKKTYLVVVATIAYAVGGALAEVHPWPHAVQLILGALGLGGLRAGVTKSGPTEK